MPTSAQTALSLAKRSSKQLKETRTAPPLNPKLSEISVYSFASAPKVVQHKSKTDYPRSLDKLSSYSVSKTETMGPVLYGNLMYDRRVVRGNTYSRPIIPKHTDPVVETGKLPTKQKKLGRKRASLCLPDLYSDHRKQHQPPPPPEETEADVQLEELPLSEDFKVTETYSDLYWERPLPAPLVPGKVIFDKGIQVNPDDLFVFDVEVKQVLEILVGKCIEQALLEVTEEEELANIRTKIQVFKEHRHALLQERQRLHEVERRHDFERELRRREKERVTAREADLTNKIGARAFGNCYMVDLLHHVYGRLCDHGYFYDTVERDIEGGYLNHLMMEAEDGVEEKDRILHVVDTMLVEIAVERVSQYKTAAMEESIRVAQREQLLEKERAEAAVPTTPRIQIFLPDDEDDDDDDDSGKATEDAN